jgi:replication factor C subunit 3/5
MFLIDKYTINDMNDIILHKDIYNKLVIGYNIENRKLNLEELDKIIKNKSYDQFEKFYYTKSKIYSNYEMMPNLLINGPAGCGKHTLIKLLLTDIFDNTINDTFIETYHIKGYGNSIVDIDIEQSKYHIIIEPNNTGLDKYLIQEIVKEYAKKKIINVSYNKYPFRVVLINNFDNLHYYAQTSLRCNMEKYYKTCRFILCANNTSKIIEPILSRCLNIRIPVPTYEEMKNLIYYITIRENKLITKNKINDIIEQGGLNIKNTLWILQMYYYKITDYELPWKKSLDKIIEFMIELKKIKILNEKIIITTRTILYNIFTTNIPAIYILQELIKKIINSNEFDVNITHIILQLSSNTEIRLNKGKRSIIHLDTFMCKIYKEIYFYYNK